MAKLSGLLFVLLLVGVAQSVSASDMSTSETRIEPYLYGGVPFIPPVEGHIGPVIEHGLYEGHLGAGPIAYGAGIGTGYGAFAKPFIGGPFINGGGGGSFNGGFVKSGINEGALALGNKGGQIFKEAIDGGFRDGGYHHAGGFKNGGFQGIEGYNDNKHHLADDHANRLYYANVKGGKADLGNGAIYDQNNGYALNGYNTLGNNRINGHQKGHQKSGFHKSYHKDESGDDETYYDSDHDEGSYAFGKKYGDKYGTNFLSGMTGGKKFNEYSAGEGGSKGFDGTGKLIAQNHGFKDYYGKNDYFNNGNHYGGSGGIRNSELAKYGINHGYQNGFNNGKNFAGYHTGKFGGGFYGPYGYY